eukprot:Clim_evm12s208 gene=Clim_evmTU12s208
MKTPKHVSSFVAIALGMEMASAHPIATRSLDDACANESPEWQGWAANKTFWEHDLPQWDKDAMIGGILDIRPLAEEVANMGTDFEDYISPFMGDFGVTSKYDNVWSPWRTFLHKLNAVTCPVMMAPYYVDRTPDNADLWDSWFDALHALFPKNQIYNGVPMKAACVEGSDSKDVIPRFVAFPDDLTGTDANAILEEVNSPISLKSAVWSVESEREYGSPQTFKLVNTINSCTDMEVEYSESTASSFTSSSTYQYSSDVTRTSEWSLGASASVSMGGFGTEVSSVLTEGFEATSSQAFGSGESSSHEYEQTFTYAAVVDVPDMAIVNVSLYVDEVAVDMFYTGEGVWNNDYDGLQMHIQGYGKAFSGIRPSWDFSYYSKRDMVWQETLTTPTKILNVVKLAEELIGADWSTAFEDSLIHTSATGKSEGSAGSLVMQIWGCDTLQMTAEEVHKGLCDKELAEKYPLMRSCGGSNRRSTSDEKFDMSSLLRRDSCTQFDLIDEENQKYAVKRIC